MTWEHKKPFDMVVVQRWKEDNKVILAIDMIVTTDFDLAVAFIWPCGWCCCCYSWRFFSNTSAFTLRNVPITVCIWDVENLLHRFLDYYFLTFLYSRHFLELIYLRTLQLKVLVTCFFTVWIKLLTLEFNSSFSIQTYFWTL
jgi:hypothetical protein